MLYKQIIIEIILLRKFEYTTTELNIISIAKIKLEITIIDILLTLAFLEQIFSIKIHLLFHIQLHKPLT